MSKVVFHIFGKYKDNQYTILSPRFTVKQNDKITNTNKSQKNGLRKGNKNTIEVQKKEKLDRVLGI